MRETVLAALVLVALFLFAGAPAAQAGESGTAAVEGAPALYLSPYKATAASVPTEFVQVCEGGKCSLKPAGGVSATEGGTCGTAAGAPRGVVKGLIHRVFHPFEKLRERGGFRPFNGRSCR